MPGRWPAHEYTEIIRFKRKHLTCREKGRERKREREAGGKTQTETERARQAKRKTKPIKKEGFGDKKGKGRDEKVMEADREGPEEAMQGERK